MILEIKPLSHYQNIVQVNEFLEKLEKVKGLSAGKHFMIRNNCVPNILGNNKDGLIIDFKLNDQFKKAGTVFGKITGVFSGSKNKFEIGTKEKSGTLKIELPEVKDLEKKSLKLKNETEFKENDDLQKKYQYELTQFFIKSKYWVSVVVSNKEIIIECYDNSEVGRLEKLFTEIEIAIISKNEGFIQISPPTLPLRETIQRIRRPQTINECIKVALWILKIQGIEPIRAQNISVSEKKQEFSTPFYFKNTLELITVKKILRAYDFSFAEEDKLGSEFAFRLEFKPLENPSSNTIDVTQASPVKLPKRKPGKVAKDLGFKSSGAINIAATEKTYLYTKGTLGGSERMSVGQKDTPHELRSTWCTELKEEMRKEGYLIEESPKRASTSMQ